MGRDKLLLEVGGVPMIHRVCGALAGACDEVLVVGGEPLPGARRVSGERPGGQGPLAGIEAGLAAAKNRRVFVAAGDLPFLPETLVRYLLARLGDRTVRAVVPRHLGEAHPLCAAYDRGILPEVAAALDGGTRSVRALLESLSRVEYAGEEALARLGDPGFFLMNVNSPEDLDRARAGDTR